MSKADPTKPVIHGAEHLTTGNDPFAHKASHESGGGDQISVAGLSGHLADAQDPVTHGSTHAPGGTDPIPTIKTLKTTANQTINAGAATFVDITDLTFPVVNGVDYAFYFYITFQSAATATGHKFGVNCPTGTLDFWADSQIIANGAAGVATHTHRHNVTRDDMTLLTTTVTQAVDLAVIIQGRYKCTQDGTFAARFANELAANTNIVVQKGSWGWYF